MGRYRPGQIPKGSKWGVCSECGYRITERDEMQLVGEDMDFVHERCLSDYKNESSLTDYKE